MGRQFLQQFSGLLNVFIIQIHKGIIQNNENLLLLKQRVHQSKAHAQHHKICLACAEIRKFP